MLDYYMLTERFKSSCYCNMHQYSIMMTVDTENAEIKDPHRRQKLTTNFLKLFELTILIVNISISRQKDCLPWFPEGHF